jgi:putative ATP-binding cassette transporter
MMIQALWESPTRNTLLILAIALFVVIAATAYGQIRLNSWNQPFYDALSHRDFTEFLVQLGVFGVIAGALLVLNVAQRWLGETLKLKLRQGLVHDLIRSWMVPRHAFRLANAGDIGVNPDQRMHEDARHLTELSADLGIGLLQASILLITFGNVLWTLSTRFVFHIGGGEIAVPGYMVWTAIIYSGSASLLSYWVGRNLIARNAERYAREADLRFSLVRVNEHIDEIALAGGETEEARRIEIDVDGVLLATRKLVTGLTNLTWVTAGYGWFTLVAPILAAAPLYFAGTLSFGGLMMASGAFMQVQSSLRWFVDNFSSLADWRATLLRVASFRRAVLSSEMPPEAGSRIEFRVGAPGRILIDELEVTSHAVSMRLEESHIEVKAGERVLIVAEAGEALLFRALAGLWPWGAGRVTRPQGEAVLYVPRTPYLPPGTLQEVLAYPSPVDSFDADMYVRALDRLALNRLVPMLGEVRRWDAELSDAEQQSLSFARVLLHLPPWLLIDETLETLHQDILQRIMDILRRDLSHCGIIYIGLPVPGDLFTRMLHLVKVSGTAHDATQRMLRPQPVALVPR